MDELRQAFEMQMANIDENIAINKDIEETTDLDLSYLTELLSSVRAELEVLIQKTSDDDEPVSEPSEE
jgi:hypothetical protein